MLCWETCWETTVNYHHSVAEHLQLHTVNSISLALCQSQSNNMCVFNDCSNIAILHPAHAFLSSTPASNKAKARVDSLFRTLAILGAGLMGAGVAQVSIDKGYKVLMKDMSPQGLARGQDQINKGLKTQVKKRKITRYKCWGHVS